MSHYFDKFCQTLALDKTSSVHPAEIHGLGCGILAAGFKPGAINLFEQINEYVGDEAVYNESLVEFFQESLRTLESGDFTFQLCLPDDDSYGLMERAESLSAWCAGFLHGFAAIQNPLSREARELLGDLSEISRLDAMSLSKEIMDEASEMENENHYAELTEFVRLAAISLFMDNNKESVTDDQDGSKKGNQHVHH